MKKRLFKNLMFVMAMVILCFAVTITVNAEERAVVDSGKCGAQGDNVIWNFYDDGELVISGQGEMKDYKMYDSPPWAEYRSKIESIVINEGITKMGRQAFYMCDVSKVSLPGTLTNIGEEAFWRCDNLRDVTIPYGVTIIERNAFYSCDHLNITIPGSVTTIGPGAFSGCLFLNKYSLTLPEGLKTIESSAFDGCTYLNYINLPASIEYIADNAFGDCLIVKITVNDKNTHFCNDEYGSLYDIDKTRLIRACDEYCTTYNIPETVKSIDPCAFYYCKKLTSVTIPEGVTSIRIGTFYNCEKLVSLTIPTGVTTIENWAFGYCDRLKSIVIPDSVTTIGKRAFQCQIESKLQHIGYTGTEEQWNEISIGENNSSLKKAQYMHFNFNLENDIIENISPSTCINEGSKTTICSCGYTYGTETLPTVSCSFTSYTSDNNSTCIDNGTKTAYCDYNCGESKTVTDEDSALGHNMDKFIVTKEASCTVNGEERADCSRCDYYETRELIASNHKDKNHDGYCDECKDFIADKNCNCICHDRGIWGFIYRIFRAIKIFFKVDLLSKVFHIDWLCDCGIAHY